jgi:hypothetical protein
MSKRELIRIEIMQRREGKSATTMKRDFTPQI